MQKLLTLHLGRHAVLFLAENKLFTEFEFATGNDLETSKVPLSVLFCIIEKNALIRNKGNNNICSDEKHILVYTKTFLYCYRFKLFILFV